MISFKCRNCGGEMSVTRNGDLCCSYCGSKTVFNDKDLRDYKEFRLKMLTYLSEISDRPHPEETERIWNNAVSEEMTMSDGRPLTVRYLFKGVQDDVVIYTARKNVLFVFPEGKKEMGDRFANMITKLSYPSADIKGLSGFFPVISGRFELNDNRTLLSVAKDEEIYPLSAFGSLPPEHAAWIISRLESLCCVLAYSDISHRGIGLESVFINARTHQASLLGGWWNAGICEGGDRQDLIDMRNTAKRLTGLVFGSAPAQFCGFINDPPAADAFEDFELWDKVIEEGFNGRTFRKLDLSRLQI